MNNTFDDAEIQQTINQPKTALLAVKLQQSEADKALANAKARVIALGNKRSIIELYQVDRNIEALREDAAIHNMNIRNH